jgi:3-hydroxymyristoyl/3-hydroxydecanoyl-(acyl carrier protein) dehydratase
MIDLEKELFETFEMVNDSKKIELGTFEVDFFLPKSLSYFSGHFPQIPVLPAVAIVDITSFFLSKLMTNDPDFKVIHIRKIKKMKMRKPLGPGEKIKIRIQKETDGEFSFVWKSPIEDKNFVEASFSLHSN